MSRGMTLVILSLIILLGFFLRIFQINRLPPGLSSDEVAFAYNAYTILQNQSDQFGEKWPFYFESFGEYKNPVPVYILVPFLSYFGNNALAVRLPMVILSSLSILVLYLIIKKLFLSNRFALLVSFFLAVSSWHIFFSRFSNGYLLGMVFLLAGIFFFLKSREAVLLAAFSGIFFLLSFYSYHSTKLVILAILPMLFWLFPIKRRSAVIVFCSLFLLGILPAIFYRQKTIKRVEMVTLTANPELGEKITNYIHDFKPGEMPIWFIRSFVNKPVIYSKAFLDQLIYHFSAHFLIFESDEDPLFHFPDQGAIFLWQFPLLILGSFWLLKEKISFFLFYFWLVAVLPSGLSASLWSASSRSFLSIIPILIISGYGGNYLLKNYLVKKRWSIILSLGVSLMIVYSVAEMLMNYFFHFRREAIVPWRYGDSQTVSFIRKNLNNYEKIVIDNNLLLAEHFLFFSKLTPKDLIGWELKRTTNEYGFTHTEQLDKLIFLDKIKTRYRLRNTQGKVLWVGFSGNKPEAPCLEVITISSALGFGQEIIAVKNNEKEDFRCES